MEIVGEGDSKTNIIKEGSRTDFGRGNGFASKDRTVSRRHVCFQLLKDEKSKDPNAKTRVHFQVIGKNPIWVHKTTKGKIKLFRRFEGDEMKSGDMFCISAKDPVWFSLKRLELEGQNDNEVNRELGFQDELEESLGKGCEVRSDSELEFESIDVADIDPVKEFGFVVMGHEFDSYPKKMVRAVKDWDWFLVETREESDSELDEVSKKNRKKRGKRKKGEVLADDDEWIAEGEDDKELMTKVRKVQGAKYSTRSKDHGTKIQGKNKNSQQKKSKHIRDYTENDDEDETLGGFIVTDDEVELDEEEGGDTDEEEEEFLEYEEEDEE